VNTSASPPNRLAAEKSPYLLQHRHNPVDWFPWGEAAFDRARREGRPIFLSIGYSTCHWCHVMERESFEDEAVARMLNEHFVSIKVDREERPDVDKIYMTFVQATTGQGGWPLNVFLTPDRKPFFGGTYFPPDSRHGRPGFPAVLRQIAQLWETRRDDLVASAAGLHERLDNAAREARASASPLTIEVLHEAARRFKEEYDPRHGGFGGAPKFPRPSQPAFLLRHGVRFGDDEATRMVLHTCERMAAGGIRDHLGGGFARYAVDAEWTVPHFEKMLYDNAQLVSLYLDAFLVSGTPGFAEVVREILTYVLRDLTHPEGGFYSAEDADSEGKEGKFYCWTRRELEPLLSPEEFNVTVRHFGITEAGNFIDHSDPNPLRGQNVLRLAGPELPAVDRPLFDSARRKMLEARARRIRPGLDDKVLASWNGLMLGALARASAVLGEDLYREAAERNLAFLQAKLWDPEHQTLYHRWRDGERDAVQLLNAYAFLLAGVIDLYEITLAPTHLEFALALAESMIRRFHDPANGGFWQSAADSADLILRMKEDYDGAEPSGNSVACLALLKLAVITGRKEFRDVAERGLLWLAPRLQHLPQAVPSALAALDFWLEEPNRVVVVGEPGGSDLRALVQAAHSVYQPNRVVLGHRGPVESFAKTLPRRPAAAAYVCTGTSCQPPTQDANQLRSLLTGP
jgi:uncharacterized protein YyaL (SSP411 family)